MADWNTERMQINCRVRAVLVSHYVDLGRIAFSVYPQKLSLRGTLVSLPGFQRPFTGERVEHVMKDLADIPKVRRVVANLDNWRKDEDSDKWIDAGNVIGRLIKPDPSATPEVLTNKEARRRNAIFEIKVGPHEQEESGAEDM